MRNSGTKDSWTTLWTRNCWRQPASDSERMEAMRREIAVSHKVYFVADPELDERDRLVFSDGNYLVKSRPHPDASVGRGVVWRVMVDDSK